MQVLHDAFGKWSTIENGIMQKSCSKCLTEIPEEYFVDYAIPEYDGLNIISLCLQCNNIYDNRVFLLKEFLEEDFGKFPIARADKMMIESRKMRSLGKGAWQTNEDLLQKIT